MTLKVGSRNVIGVKRGILDVPAFYRANFRASLNRFANATGGTETYHFDGTDFWKIHTFTDVGNHTLTFGRGGEVEYLVVAGGGGGGSGRGGEGGGGGGGFLDGTATLSEGQKTVTVGGGGLVDETGDNSVLDDIIAFGGGYGASRNINAVGGNGGSGGGSYHLTQGGLGTPGQGHNGGPRRYSGGGGGGAGGPAVTNGYLESAGRAGIGRPSSISGAELYYGGGGTGGDAQGLNVHAPPLGGGGRGAAFWSYSPGYGGTPNTGGGGGGGGNSRAGHPGGSGIVIVRYKITEAEYLANT